MAKHGNYGIIVTVHVVNKYHFFATAVLIVAVSIVLRTQVFAISTPQKRTPSSALNSHELLTPPEALKKAAQQRAPFASAPPGKHIRLGFNPTTALCSNPKKPTGFSVDVANDGSLDLDPFTLILQGRATDGTFIDLGRKEVSSLNIYKSTTITMDVTPPDTILLYHITAVKGITDNAQIGVRQPENDINMIDSVLPCTEVDPIFSSVESHRANSPRSPGVNEVLRFSVRPICPVWNQFEFGRLTFNIQTTCKGQKCEDGSWITNDTGKLEASDWSLFDALDMSHPIEGTWKLFGEKHAATILGAHEAIRYVRFDFAPHFTIPIDTTKTFVLQLDTTGIAKGTTLKVNLIYYLPEPIHREPMKATDPIQPSFKNFDGSFSQTAQFDSNPADDLKLGAPFVWGDFGIPMIRSDNASHGGRGRLGRHSQGSEYSGDQSPIIKGKQITY